MLYVPDHVRERIAERAPHLHWRTVAMLADGFPNHIIVVEPGPHTSLCVCTKRGVVKTIVHVRTVMLESGEYDGRPVVIRKGER
jgi:hypothetical protein